MLGIGKNPPQFKLKATVSIDPKTAFTIMTNELLNVQLTLLILRSSLSLRKYHGPSRAV